MTRLNIFIFPDEKSLVLCIEKSIIKNMIYIPIKNKKMDLEISNSRTLFHIFIQYLFLFYLGILVIKKLLKVVVLHKKL